MSRFIGRSLLACSLLLVLIACQSTTQQINEPTIDQFAVAESLFDTHLAAQQLQLAGQQLEELRTEYPDEQRITVLQQRLANAWLESGERALQEADLETASAALMQAKRLLPQAPALTEGLSAALAAVQTPALEPVVAAPTPAKRPAPRKAPAPKKPAVISEPVAPVSVEQVEPEVEAQPPVSEPNEPKKSKIKARIIDANAVQTVVPMPMLNNGNDHQLGRLLDDVAVDVVRFRAAVIIEVADTRDFHWVAALLSARVKKLDANFKPRLEEVIRSNGLAQLIITPNKSL